MFEVFLFRGVFVDTPFSLYDVCEISALNSHTHWFSGWSSSRQTDRTVQFTLNIIRCNHIFNSVQFFVWKWMCLNGTLLPTKSKSFDLRPLFYLAFLFFFIFFLVLLLRHILPTIWLFHGRFFAIQFSYFLLLLSNRTQLTNKRTKERTNKFIEYIGTKWRTTCK